MTDDLTRITAEFSMADLIEAGSLTITITNEPSAQPEPQADDPAE